jgi:histidyl-tRNA synthetase
LDYYRRTTFEITSGLLGAQNTLVGGGRYDGLSEAIGGPPAQGFGFALGLERLIHLLDPLQPSTEASGPAIFLAPLGDAAFQKATLLAKTLRRKGVRCALDFEARSLKSAMRLANKLRAGHVLILGENELAARSYPLKRMADSTQTVLSEEEFLNFSF